MTVESPPTSSAFRFESLDALRGICALLVALVHFNTSGYISSSAFVRNSYIFVDYFFVLSGFVIAHSYGDKLRHEKISIPYFMALRLGRIYPLHLATLLAFLALDVALQVAPAVLGHVSSRSPFEGPRSVSALVSNLLLLHSFGLHPYMTWNLPSWSIAAEVWTYLVFALLVANVRKPTIWIAAISVAAFATLVAAKPSIDATYDFGFVRCLYGFSLGALTYAAYRRSGPRGGHILETAVVLVVVLFVSLMHGRWTFAAPLLFAGAVYILASGTGYISKLLRRPVFQVLGLASYSIYMLHAFFEMRFLQFMHIAIPNAVAVRNGELSLGGTPLVSDVLTVLMLAALVGASLASYHLIEKPGRSIVRKWLGPSVAGYPLRAAPRPLIPMRGDCRPNAQDAGSNNENGNLSQRHLTSE